MSTHFTNGNYCMNFRQREVFIVIVKPNQVVWLSVRLIP